MSPWQILHAGRASRGALSYHVYHPTGVVVHYSTATSASSSPDGSRSFCLSREKLTLQQLNRRLALYLKQVQCLEATNHMLEFQIQNVLDKKYPKELKELDRHLKAASLLQDQISEEFSAQALLKLQLINTELSAFHFSVRCEKERKHREQLEKKLSNLRLQDEELKLRKLPELQSLLSIRTQELMEKRIQHQQSMQRLLAQVSGGIGIQTEITETSDLIQQMGDLRQTSETLINKNQNQCFFNSQVSMLRSPDLSFDSEVVWAGLKDLRRTAASLQEELDVLQSLNALLKASGLGRTEALDLQLVDLQQRADCLCREMDSVVQATAQQAADHQNLLEIKTQLETEIHAYISLLDELSQESHFASESGAPQDRTLVAKGGNLRVMEFHRGHVCTPPQETGTGSKSMAITSAMKNKQSRPLKDDVHTEDGDMLKSTDFTQISQDLDKVDVVQSSKTDTQRITMLVHNQLSARNVALQTKPKAFTSKESKKAFSLEANTTGTSIQTETPNAKPRAQAELKQGPHCSAQTDTANYTQAAVVLKSDTGNGMLAQTNSCRDSVQEKATSKTAAEIVVTLDETPGLCLCRPKGGQVEVSALLTSTDKNVEGEAASAKEKSIVQELDQSSLCDVSNSKQDKLKKDENTRSNTAYVSQNSEEHLGSNTASTEIFTEGLGFILIKEKVDNSFHDTKEVKDNHPFINFPHQEAVLSTKESKKSTSLADSGVASSLSESELSPRESDVFLNPTSPEIFSGSPQKELSMSFTDQVFFPLDLEDYVRDPDFLLSPNDPVIRHSPEIRPNWSVKPKDKNETKQTGLGKAKAQMRPDTCIISTKVEEQSLSFSGAHHVLPERDTNKRIIISPRDGDSLCFGSFEGQGIGSSDIGDFGLTTSGGCSIFAKKEEKVVDNLYTKTQDGKTSRDKYKYTDRVANKDPQSLVSRYFLETQRETPLPVLAGSVVRSSGDMAVGSTSVTKDRGALLSSTSATSSGSVCSNGESVAGVQAQFRQRCCEWMLYGSSRGSKSSWDSGTSSTIKWTTESPLMATLSAASQQDIGRFGRQENKERMVNRGRLGRESSLDGDTSLLKKERGQSLSVSMDPVTTSSAETETFGKRESGGWTAGMFKSSRSEMKPESGQRMVCNSSNGLANVESTECLSTTTTLATSPPRTGRFGIRGIGEWRGSRLINGHMSTVVGCNNNTDSKESQSVDRKLSTSPSAAGRFGSGEWHVYGGRNGFLCGAGGADRVNDSEMKTISPPNDYNYTVQGLSGANRGGPTSGGVFRRSRSVGSSSRLSSSGSGGTCSSSSHRVSSPGNCPGNGSDARKPMYRSTSGSRCRVVSAGLSSGRQKNSIKTSPSPSRRANLSGVSSRWLSSSTDKETGIRCGNNQRFKSQIDGGFSSSPPSERPKCTVGRVINSSDRPIRILGSVASGNKARVSVCKMAALSISAAGREKSQERRGPAQQLQH